MKSVQVEMDNTLFERLKEIAAEHDTSPESMLSELARDYIQQWRSDRIDKEMGFYIALHPTLKEKYLGQYVAIYGGELVDHDADIMALAKRVKLHFGNEPVLMTEVAEKPVREYVIHSTRLVWEEEHRKGLAEQTRRFWAKYDDLYRQYPEEYVTFYDDTVLDHDHDIRALALRAQKNYRDLPVVIGQLTQPPVREYRMISSHLRRRHV